MKCAIMQPTYFPWAGYFNLMTQVDCFVFLDDVQFDHRSWQQRNRIMLEGKPKYITVPVYSRGRRDQLIKEVLIDDQQPWRKKHTSSIKHAYSRYPYFSDIKPLFDIIADGAYTYLSDLNISIISIIASKLGLSYELHRSSELGLSGHRSEHLRAICEKLGCNQYLSPVGSVGYLEADGVFNRGGIKISFQDFIPQPYPLPEGLNFISHLSILDVLASAGWRQAASYVSRGYL